MDCSNRLLYVLLHDCAIFTDSYSPDNKSYSFIVIIILINGVVLLFNSLVLIHLNLHPSVHLSHFYINLNISFIYKDIFIKFVENVYGYANMYVQNLKNKMAAITNCLKVIKMI